SLSLIPCLITLLETPDAPDARSLHWPRQPDEHARSQRLYRGVAGVRARLAPAQSNPRGVGALVLRRDRGDRDGEAKDDPRLLRLSAGALRVRLSREGRSRSRRRN